MHTFLDEVRATLNAGIYSPALLGALVIPDVCGAVEYPDLPNGQRYKSWMDAYFSAYQVHKPEMPTDDLPSPMIELSGNAFWYIRNAMIHETKLDFSKFGFDRIFFGIPRLVGMNIGISVSESRGEWIVQIAMQKFCDDMFGACERWLAAIKGDAEKQDRLMRMVQFRPGGYGRHFLGVPVIG